MKAKSPRNPDILIAGAGIIGVSLALELHARGAHVTILERNTALAQASTAAAGMLASQDPHNPAVLHSLARLGASLYPDFLARVASLSGLDVPFQTHTTIQYLPDRSPSQLAEHSLDPRQLAAALLTAVRATSIDLREQTAVLNPQPQDRVSGLKIQTASDTFFPSLFVSTIGAWQIPHVHPAKGQMLRVKLPPTLQLREVHRNEHIYIVPRTQGPQAGTALIGATVEDAGFDFTTHASDLTHLRQLAATLLPELASVAASPQVEAWAGLRPATPDGLPLLGASVPGSKHFLATGHFRNGILLAPATAMVLADLLENKSPTIDISPFAPDRFATP